MRKLLSLLLLFCATPVLAQTIGQNREPGGDKTFTLSVRSQLVVEAVTVKDTHDNSVSGLRAGDFTLTEDGAVQKLRFAEHQMLPTTTPQPPASGSENITIYKQLHRTEIAPESAGNLRYKDHRLLALYFDMTAMGTGEQQRALRAAEAFVRTQMTAADLISILRYSGGSLDVLQDFTADRSRLLSLLDTMVVGEGQEWATGTEDASTADTGAAFGQDASEFNVFNTDRQLSALQTAANILGHLNEKKVLIYFAGGLRLNGVDNQAQLHATVDAAIRAGVSFWPIDARGLVADAPLGDATQGSPGNQSVYSGVAGQATQTGFQESQDTLFALAGDTGGKALLDTNDLAGGIVKAQQSVSDYYILGYYTTNVSLDGRFRHIKITVNNGAAAKIDYRQGYYAGKDFAKFTTADKERQLEDALMLEDPITELPMAMELNYFQLNSAEYFVPVVVKIPGSELALAKHGGAEHTLIDFIGEIKDVYSGSTITNVRDHVNVKLTDATETQLQHLPIEYDAGFTLLPGRYRIKLLARDDETGRIGTYEMEFNIPNLNKEEQRVPISSVVLSSQRVNFKDAVYNAQKSKDEAKEALVNPLVAAGSKLIPSVTRVFSRGRALYVYLQGYEQGTAAEPLIAYISFYRGERKQFDSQPITVTPQQSAKLKTVPLSFSVPLDQFQPGEYVCQVSVLNPTSGKTAFWRASIKVMP